MFCCHIQYLTQSFGGKRKKLRPISKSALSLFGHWIGHLFLGLHTTLTQRKIKILKTNIQVYVYRIWYMLQLIKCSFSLRTTRRKTSQNIVVTSNSLQIHRIAESVSTYHSTTWTTIKFAKEYFYFSFQHVFYGFTFEG